MRPPKILILTTEFPPQPGGIGNHALHLAKGLQGQGQQVTVLCDRRSGDGAEEASFDKTLDFEVMRIKRQKFMLLSYLNRIKTAFHLARAHGVILASGKFSLWLGGFLSLLLKKRYVAVIHGSEVLLKNKTLRNLTDWSLRRYDTVIAVSHYTASLVENLKLKEVQVIPNGFEMAAEIPQDQQPALTPKLITVGNVTERKGQHNVISALPVLLKRFPQLQYHIVGIPTDRTRLEKLAATLEVVAAVKFHGKVSERRKQELLQGSDVFVMLSEHTASGDVEGFGIAILEANALGLPGIGAKGCGIEDAIKEGYSGKLIHNKDHVAFARALEEIMGDYEVYSQNARAWAKGFTWDRIIPRYIEAISQRKCSTLP